VEFSPSAPAELGATNLLVPLTTLFVLNAVLFAFVISAETSGASS
jgi:hypothetical protein